MATEKKSWVKDLLVAFAATTLSIILTFGTTAVVNRVRQKQERKLTALMVMSSIEQFARDLELIEKQYAYMDSIATWLLSLPIETVAQMDDGPIVDALVEVSIVFPLLPTTKPQNRFSAAISIPGKTWGISNSLTMWDGVSLP